MAYIDRSRYARTHKECYWIGSVLSHHFKIHTHSQMGTDEFCCAFSHARCVTASHTSSSSGRRPPRISDLSQNDTYICVVPIVLSCKRHTVPRVKRVSSALCMRYPPMERRNLLVLERKEKCDTSSRCDSPAQRNQWVVCMAQCQVHAVDLGLGVQRCTWDFKRDYSCVVHRQQSQL